MKADTMNEKTIELPPFSELARLTHWLDAKYARHKEIEDADASKLLHTLWRAAHRSRAASEPGEVARLAEGRTTALFDAIEEVIRHHKLSNMVSADDETEAFPLVDLLAPKGSKSIQPGIDEIRYLVDAIFTDDAVNSALASMATSPASEAQADLYRIALQNIASNKPLREEGSKLAGSHERMRCFHCGHAWLPDCTPHHAPDCAYVEATNALAAAPLPASSPVAAEGQNLGSVLALKGAERANLSPKSLDFLRRGADALNAEVRKSRAEKIAAIANIPLATPTASMADAAEAAAEVVGTHNTRTLKFLPAGVHLPLGALLYAAPGPRGENAGGVVEALSRDQLEPLWRKHCHAIGVIAVQDFNFACAVMNACATAWGLRIAEKGDAS